MRLHYASALFLLPAVIFWVFTSIAQGQGVPPGSDYRSLNGSPPGPGPRPDQNVPPVPGSSISSVSDLVSPLPDSGQQADRKQTGAADDYERVWGVIGMRGFVFGDQVAPNGVEYMPFFTLDMDFNMWICSSEHVYLFVDTGFWAQKPGPGITNPSQGYFDFSKRELEFSAGVAWNYCSNWEARIFAYSYNNLNRGDSLSSPSGFNDGIGIENRWYLSDEYERLGKKDYDVDRAPFVSAGYYPTKDMIDNGGNLFKPSLFARAYLVQNLYKDILYAYLDTQFITEKPATPKMLYLDGGFAFYPFSSLPYLQFRLGSQDSFDFQMHEWEATMYLGVRVRF